MQDLELEVVTPDNSMKIRYGFQQVDEVEIFYREAGPKDAPVILLLHGFPSASHMFRDLFPLLADRFRLVGWNLLCLLVRYEGVYVRVLVRRYKSN